MYHPSPPTLYGCRLLHSEPQPTGIEGLSAWGSGLAAALGRLGNCDWSACVYPPGLGRSRPTPSGGCFSV